MGEKANHSAARRWWRIPGDDLTVAQAQASLDAFCARVGHAQLLVAAVRLLCAGQAVSAAGDQLFPVAVTVQVLDSGGSIGSLGLVLAARFAALVLFAPGGRGLGGPPAAPEPAIGADASRLVAVLGLAAVAGLRPSFPVLAALTFLVGAGEAFFRPAYGALLPTVVPAQDLPSANGLSGSTFHLAAVVGPSLGGLLVAGVGPRGAFALDTATFGVSLLTLLRVREPGAGRAAAAAAGRGPPGS